jgi:hypothetical protein
MYKNLLELIKLIFGPKAISKTIGTRTNVIQLPNNKTKRYIKSDLDIESASDAAAMNAKKEMEELIAEIPKMNDAERLIFEGNLRRLKNRLGIRSETDSTADVFEFGTKEKVTPGGIASLTEKAGQKSPPGTIMGNLESRIKQLEASGEDLSKMKGQTLDEIMGDVMQTQKTMSKMQDEGLVRAAVRYKMMDDLKRGTLKLPKNLEDVVRGASNEEDVITVFRNNYGEDALEQVDSLIPDFYKMTSPADAVKKIEKDFPNMKPRKIETKQTMDLDEAAKAEQENILTPGKAIPADSPEGKKITEALIGKPKAEVVSLPTAEKILSDMRNLGPIDAMKEANKVLKREGPYKNLTDKDIEKIMDDINDHIFGGDLPVDPEDFANGGRVGYSDGTKPSAEENTPSQEIINRMMAQIKQMSKMGADIDTIKTITGASDQMIKDVLGKASGGSMSTGLDYLMGIERRGYVGGGFGSVPGVRFPPGFLDPMEAMYVNTFGFNPFPKYGFNSYMDYNTARTTGTPMNQNISDLEDYLGTLESAREINLPGVTKDLSAEDISRLQEEYVKKMAKTSNALNPTVTASTAASTPDYRQQALSEMLSRYNVSSLGDIKNFNYLIPGYKDKNNLEVRAFETRIPDLAVSRRAQQLEDAAIRAQQDQETYKNRISQVDPNALRNSYLQNLQNTSSQSIDQFQSKLRSNLVPRKKAAQGLDYLTGMDRNNYQYGGDVYEKYLSYLNELESMGAPTSSNILYSQPNYMYQQSDGDGTEDTPTPTGVPSTFQPTKMDMFSLAVNPAYGIPNIASRTKTGLSLMDRAMDAMGIGRGPGGRTEGFGVDSVNAQSVSDEGTVDANEGFGNQGGDDGPAGPGGAAGGGSDGADANDGFAQGGIVNRTKNADGGLNYLLGF